MSETAPTEGLRARQKQQTKETIAAAAAELFADRGYAAVTMVDIARAAGVSEPTVYNHFPSKERLVFDRDDETLRGLASRVLDRPEGTSIASSLRDRALEIVDYLATAAAPDPRGGMAYIVASTPELRPHMLEMTVRWADALASSLSSAADPEVGQIATRAVIRCLVSIYQVVIDEIGAGLLAGDAPSEVAQRIRPEIEHAYGSLETGLRDY